MGKSFVMQFDERHGYNGIGKEGWFFFADGAKRCGELLVEPPPDPFERNRNIVLYWSMRTKEAVAQFDALRNQLAQRAAANKKLGYGPPGGLNELKELKEEVQNCQRFLELAQRELEAVAPQTQQPQGDSGNHFEEGHQDFLEQLGSIQV